MSNKKNYNKVSTENVVTNDEVISVEEPVVPEVVTGIVTGCKLLNVRTKPNKKADIVGVIKVDTVVEIDESASSRDFYKIKSGEFSGYCMKKFIEAKS